MPSSSPNGVPVIKKTSQIVKRAQALGVAENMICCMCLELIRIQIFKGTGVCCEHCRKDRDNDHEPFRGGARTP